jgi:DNA-binding Lrp family transcriptional regulator
MSRENNIHEKIVEVLRQNSDGLTILDIAQNVGAHRHTVTKYVYELVGAKIVKMRKISSAKLCYLVQNQQSTVE